MKNDFEPLSTEREAEAVSKEERYKFVTSQLIYCNEKILQTFTFFIKLISTFVGGLIWLRLQSNFPTVWSQTKGLAVAVFLLSGVGTFLMIYRYLRTWWGFRQAESNLTAGAVPTPKFPRSCQTELFMMLVVVVTTVAGARFLSTFK